MLKSTVCAGRAEINIKPWDALQKDLDAGNRRVRWIDREPYAYWKGNPDVAAIRQELVKCNVSSKQEWNARIYKQVLVCEYAALHSVIHERSVTFHFILASRKSYWPSNLEHSFFFK